MSLYEYYTNTPYTNFCKQQGYYDKMEHLAMFIRNHADITHRSLVSKPSNMQKVWPLKSDKQQESVSVVMTPEILEQIIKNHGIEGYA